MRLARSLFGAVMAPVMFAALWAVAIPAMKADDGGGGGSKAKAETTTNPTDDAGCEAKSRMKLGGRSGKLIASYTVAPSLTAAVPTWKVQVNSSTFKSGTVEKDVPIGKVVVTFPRGYEPAGANKNRQLIVPVNDGVAVVRLGNQALTWDRDSVKVTIGGVANGASADDAAECKTEVSIGQRIAKAFECLADIIVNKATNEKALRKVYKVTVQYILTETGWKYSINNVQGGYEPGYTGRGYGRIFVRESELSGKKNILKDVERAVGEVSEERPWGSKMKLTIRTPGKFSCKTEPITPDESWWPKR